mgnify:CR=1 FL=1|jgi:hypothetical protein
MTTEEEWKPTINIVVDGCEGEKEVTIKTEQLSPPRQDPPQPLCPIRDTVTPAAFLLGVALGALLVYGFSHSSVPDV